MSRSYSRSISGSRSQTSIGTSAASRKSVNVNYHQIALELINGAPLELVTKRDLRNVLIELSILRSEANGVKNYVRSDQIKDIIMALNERITPPPMRCTAKTTPRSSTIDSSDILSPSKETFDENEKMNSFTHTMQITIKSLPEDEYNDISTKIDKMLEAQKKNNLTQVLKQQNYNDAEYPKFKYVINDRKEIYLNNFRYRELKILDELTDKIRPLPYDSRPDYYEDKIEQLKTRIVINHDKVSETEAHKFDDVNSLKQQKKDELQKLEEKHKTEIKRFNDNSKSISQAAIKRQSIALKQMRMNERSAALSRDYKGAEKIHRNADIKEAEEKNENLLKCEEDRLRNKDLLEKKQKAQIDCMEQHFDYLIQKKETNYNKDIDANIAAIEAAEKQITYFEGKRKKLQKPPKLPTD